MENQDLEIQNTNVLANSTELATQVIMNIAGNAIANSVNGETVTPSGLRESVTAKIQGRLDRKGAV